MCTWKIIGSSTASNTRSLLHTLGVKVRDHTLNVNVTNLPLRTTVEQPVEVTSEQLMAKLSAIDTGVKQLGATLQNIQEKANSSKSCPVIASFSGFFCYPAATSCFCLLATKPTNFADAQTFCKSLGFDGLVSMQTKEKWILVSRLYAAAEKAWTSGSFSAATDNFVWTSTGEEFTYTAWDAGEHTSATDGACVQMMNNGYWVSVPCTDTIDFLICELSNVSNPIG